MSKRSQKKAASPSPNTRYWGIVAVVILALVAVGAVLLLGNGESDDSEAALSDSAPVALADLSSEITPQQYNAAFLEANASHFLLDVRTPQEFQEGHLENASNIAVEILDSRLAEVPPDQPIVLYCRSGNRSAQAAQILRANGYTQVYDLGGIIDWEAAGYPVIQ